MLVKAEHTKNTSRFMRREVFAMALLLVCLGICIWRIPYGICGQDEALYLSIPYRVLQGDRLLIHEWQVTQLSSLLLLPLMRLFLFFNGSTEGVVIAFRSFFIFFHGLTALYIYLRLRKTSLFGATFAAAQLLVFAPINVASLSYYIMGIDLLAVVFVTFATGGSKLEAIICGACFACAVLCNPYYFVLYFVYIAAMLFMYSKKVCAAFLRPGFFCLFTLAGAALAVIFAAKLFLPFDGALLSQTLKLILYSDTEHPPLSISGILFNTFSAFRKSGFFLHTAAGCTILSLLYFFDRKKVQHQAFYLACAALLSILFALSFYLNHNQAISVYMFPVSIAGFFVWLFSKEKNEPVFLYVYIPGVLCWFCMSAASNLGYYTISSVSAITMIASMVIIGKKLSVLKLKHLSHSAAALCLLLAVIGPLCGIVSCRISTIFPARPAVNCTERINHGAQRGLIVTPEELQRYEYVRNCAEAVRTEANGSVAYFSDITTLYLDDSKACAVFSAWFPINYLSENLPRTEEYWALFPERKPDHVVINTGNQSADQILTEFFTERGYKPISNNTHALSASQLHL